MIPKTSSLLATLALAAALVAGAEAARILALFPSPSRSNIISFEALTKELAARGHHLTVISSFPQDKPPANYTDVFVPPDRFGLNSMNMFEAKTWDVISFVNSGGKRLCDNFLGDPGVQKIIHSDSEDDHFDLVLIGFAFNECLLGFAHKYQAPIVAMVPMGGAPSVLDIMGNPSPYAYVPNIVHSFNDRMTFTQRLINTLSCTMSSVIRKLILLPNQDAKMREYFGAFEPIPYIEEIEASTSLMLLNNHFSIGFPKPLLPNVIEIGGMHIRAPKKLPGGLQTFLDGASDGVIYFSLGSNLKASQMTDEKRGAFVSVFASLKQRVLWKADMDHIDGLPSNVMLGKWLPQIDILAHKNVRMFITHGGLLSTQEAIYHGVPVLGIPVFGDQQMNMRNAELSGYAVTLEYANLTTTSVSWALNEVLNEPRYRDTIKQLSERFRDQPSTALEQAVFWTEYVLRHEGAPHLRTAALDLAWYQYFLLDVLTAAALAVAMATLAVCAAVQVARRLLGSGKMPVSIAEGGKKRQ